ncbi:SEC-C metal-binding domain-containing protein [Halomonas alkalisoli]|uniref:SEC-C metal-binding domain-containing protein n=1 Tax=Halomonas alkalisoli TaxID=2907158 RepID=UPI001F2E0240|nr:SEC-C metal-binding domain-containing protein [Halomonas alkalisoli]MCE9684314.1 SEC-C domain-containing protein [Halomonas alkalisoli]
MQHDELPEIPPELEQSINHFLKASVWYILRHQNAERFLQAMPEIASLTKMTDWFDASMPFWNIGRSIWNVTPLPAQGFRPQPLAEPQRNAPCPCGSGKKYKRCCQQVAAGHTMSLAEEMPVVHLAVSMFTRQQCQAAAKSAPPKVRLAVAQRELDDDHPGKARSQLLALLGKGGLDPDLQQHAVGLLSDVYERLGHHVAGQKAFHQLLPSLKPPAAAEALCWLSAQAVSDGHPERALTHVLHAETLDPESLSVALHKILCLRALGADDEARSTAQDWLPLALDSGDEAVIAMFEEQARLATMEEPGNDDAFLLEPTEEEPEPGDDQDIRLLFGAPDDQLEAVTRLLIRATNQPLYPVHFEPGPPDPDSGAPSQVLMLPPEVEKTEGVLYRDPDGIDPLDAELIRHHPALLQNAAFLEQLSAYAGRSVSNAQHAFNQVLARQQERLVEHILAALPEAAQLPWGWIEHRPVLRMMTNQALAQLEGDEPDTDAAAARLTRVLALCPQDNLGVRSPLINLLLRQGHDAEALAIAERYLGDHLAETHYGRVLALVRLSRLYEAEKALQSAHQALPKVLKYLLANKRKPPKLDPGTMTIGGADQAWYYREEMRDVFAATPGMLAWMDKTRKRFK